MFVTFLSVPMTVVENASRVLIITVWLYGSLGTGLQCNALPAKDMVLEVFEDDVEKIISSIETIFNKNK